MSSIIQNKFHDILGDAARLSKFNFILPPVSGSADLMDHIIYSVKGLTLPTMEHTPLEFRHKGLPILIRGVTKFSQNFSVTFYLSENHMVKRFFEEWMAMIEQRHYYYNPRTFAAYQRTTSGIQNDLPPYMTWYNVTAWIEQYDFDGMTPTAIYEVFNVFPTKVDAPTYAHESVGSIGEFTVTFACSHYKLHSKGAKSAEVQNQLFNTTNKWAILGEPTDLGSPNGAPYMKTPGEYHWDSDRFMEYNSFETKPGVSLEQTEDAKQEIYWRPYEIARWDNMWNRQREVNGENRGAGTARREIDIDKLESQSDNMDSIINKKYGDINAEDRSEGWKPIID